jgi:hypothetical protein
MVNKANIMRLGKYEIYSRTRFTLFLTFIMICSILILSPVWTRSSAMEITSCQTIYVEAGDTLWDIAKISVPERTDIRDYILDIMEVNELDDVTIHPGQTLQIPIY